jgi:hypothetical protein
LSAVAAAAALTASFVTTAPVTAAPPAPVVHTAAADDDMLKLLEDLTTKLKAAGSDCDRAAKDLDAWLDTNAEALPPLSQALDAHLATLNDKQLEAFGKRSAPIFDVIIRTAMKTCADHDAYQEAFQSLDLLLSGQDDEDQDLDATAP